MTSTGPNSDKGTSDETPTVRHPDSLGKNRSNVAIKLKPQVATKVLLIVDLRAQINEKMLHLKLDLKFCSQSTLNFSEKVTQNTFIPNIETDCGQFLGTRVMR